MKGPHIYEIAKEVGSGLWRVRVLDSNGKTVCYGEPHRTRMQADKAFWNMLTAFCMGSYRKNAEPHDS